VRLTGVFRQAAESRIIANAHRINQGGMPDWTRDPRSDFHFVSCRDGEDAAAKIGEIVKDRISARFGLDPIRDIQVLCPMNRGGLGAWAAEPSQEQSIRCLLKRLVLRMERVHAAGGAMDGTGGA
jgi:exodeoxyribonuclease V alpha subunit